jgi:hypothetical protein
VDPAATQEQVTNAQGIFSAVPLQAPHKVVHLAVGLLTYYCACGHQQPWCDWVQIVLLWLPASPSPL